MCEEELGLWLPLFWAWAGAVTQGHSWESDPKRSLGSCKAPDSSVRHRSPKKHLERTHPIPARACPGPRLVAGRGQGGRLGCAAGLGLSGVCTAAMQTEAHVHLGTGATSHPCVYDTGAREPHAPVRVPVAHKGPAVTTWARALRDLHAAPRKKKKARCTRRPRVQDRFEGGVSSPPTHTRSPA